MIKPKLEPKVLTVDGVSYTDKDTVEIAETTLLNGDKISVYPQKHQETVQFIRHCTKETTSRKTTTSNPSLLLKYPYCCLMEVHIKKAKILALLELFPPIPKYVCDKAIHRKGLNDLLTEILYLSYQNQFYLWTSKQGKQLVESIRRGLEPEMCKLVYD
jgi:hypothetical protein